MISTSANGNQIKWEENGYWYKLDNFGLYEGLSETVCSFILNQSKFQLVVNYTPMKIKHSIHGKRIGCVSHTFLREDEKLVTIDNMLEKDNILYEDIVNVNWPIKQKIVNIVDFVVSKTEISDFGLYLSNMLYFDAYVLNDDRHFNNIAVIQNRITRKYSLCPLFDNGRALLSNVNLLMPISLAIKKLEAKPFSNRFIEQVLIAQELYGRNLQISFDYNLLQDYLSNVPYTSTQIKRVISILKYQDKNFMI